MSRLEIKDRIEGLVLKTLEELIAFQGNLKELSKEGYEKLKNSLLINDNIGIFYIWENNILDGHQRVYTLLELKKAGIKMPTKWPCIKVRADSLKQAKKFVLQYTSQHGKITKDGLYEFIHMADLTVEFDALKYEIELPSIDLGKFEEEYYLDNEPGGGDGDIDSEDEGKELKSKCPECGHEW